MKRIRDVCGRFIILWSLAGMVVLCMTGCKNKVKPVRPNPNVTTAVVEQRNVPIYIDAIGQAIPPVTVQVRPQVQGKLIATYIQQGDIVNAGDVLYTIDPRPYQDALDQAKAQLVHDEALLLYAEQTVKRYKSVVEQDFVSILTFEQYESSAAAAKAQVELDKAAVATAQLNVDFCNIVAPVSGKISYSAVDVGNVLIAYDTNAITVIRPFNPIDISFSLPQQHFELIRRVQGNAGLWPFIATLPESPKINYEGVTYFLDNQVDQNTGTILLKGRLKNMDRELWPGEFMRVKVLHMMAPNALVVPPGTILIGKDGPYLYVMDQDNKVSTHNVKVLIRTDEYIAIESAELKGGDVVVVDGQVNITPGITVNPLSHTKASKDTVEDQTKSK